MRQIERTPRSELELSRLTDWTMKHAAMVRGSINATLLRGDGYNFLNLGYYLERGDATARLMDVKYYVLLPRAGYVGTGADSDQWMMLLRALWSNRAFHRACGGEITAAKIAHFLILNPQCPRSLITCVAGANNHLSRVAKLYGRPTEAQSLATALQALLDVAAPDSIFEEGLHDFLTRFIGLTADLDQSVNDTCLSGDLA